MSLEYREERRNETSKEILILYSGRVPLPYSLSQTTKGRKMKAFWLYQPIDLCQLAENHLLFQFAWKKSRNLYTNSFFLSARIKSSVNIVFSLQSSCWNFAVRDTLVTHPNLTLAASLMNFFVHRQNSYSDEVKSLIFFAIVSQEREITKYFNEH